MIVGQQALDTTQFVQQWALGTALWLSGTYAKEWQVVGSSLFCLMGSKRWARFGWWAAGVGHNLLVGGWNSRLLGTTFWLVGGTAGFWAQPFGWGIGHILLVGGQQASGATNLVDSRHWTQPIGE